MRKVLVIERFADLSITKKQLARNKAKQQKLKGTSKVPLFF